MKSEPDIEENKATRSTEQELVKKNVKAAQIKQKNHYDRKHGAQKRRGGKLDHRWKGYHRISWKRTLQTERGKWCEGGWQSHCYRGITNNF